MNFFNLPMFGDVSALKPGELDPEQASLWRLPKTVPILAVDANQGLSTTPARIAKGIRKLLAAQPDFPEPDRGLYERFAIKQERNLFESLAAAQNAGNWKEAARIGELLTSIDSEDARAWSDLGLAYRRSRKFGQAERAYKRAVALAPSLGIAQCGLGIVFYERGDLPNAISLLEHSLKVREEMPTAHFYLGRALGEQGDDEGALRHLGRALELVPDDPRLPYFLAVALDRIGDRSSALTAVDRALALHPNWEEARELKRALLKED